MKNKKKTRQRTGAPPAHFLLSLVTGPEVLYLIEKTRAERALLAATPTKEISRSVYFQLLELASRVIYPRFDGRRLENAAEDLAMVATVAASLLEDLARTNALPEIMLAAARKNRWPVNLQLGTKRRNGELCRTLEGAEKAKDYLVSIRLGDEPERILKHLLLPDANPFTRAAEFLLMALRDLQESHAWLIKHRDLPWAQKLLSLDYPMTEVNAHEWWSVAKQWMDEQWISNRDLFAPLIKHLRLDNARFTESTVKRQVIDDSLKKAFKALAGPS